MTGVRCADGGAGHRADAARHVLCQTARCDVSDCGARQRKEKHARLEHEPLRCGVWHTGDAATCRCTRWSASAGAWLAGTPLHCVPLLVFNLALCRRFCGVKLPHGDLTASELCGGAPTAAVCVVFGAATMYAVF